MSEVEAQFAKTNEELRGYLDAGGRMVLDRIDEQTQDLPTKLENI